MELVTTSWWSLVTIKINVDHSTKWWKTMKKCLFWFGVTGFGKPIYETIVNFKHCGCSNKNIFQFNKDGVLIVVIISSNYQVVTDLRQLVIHTPCFSM